MILDKFTKKGFLVTLIVVFGVFLRLLWLGSYPVGFHSKEAKLGYRGELLAQTLTDETGRRLPLFFTSFEGYQFPLSSYLVAVSIKLFGVSEGAVRLPFAVVGSLAVLAFYKLAGVLFPKKDDLALWATLVVSINPWLVFLSRTTSELALAFHLLLILAWILAWLITNRRTKLLALVLIVVVFSVGGIWAQYTSLPGAGEDFRRDNLGFFSEPAIANSINQFRGEEQRAGNPILGRLFYNKSYYLVAFLGKLFENVKPRLYFASGDGSSLRGLSNFGPILIIFLPLFFLGLWHFVKGGVKLSAVLLFFLLILPSVLDRETVNQEKLIFTFPLIALAIGHGIGFLKRGVLVIFVLLLVFDFAVVAYDALVKEPIRGQGQWQYGVKELAARLKLESLNYDKVYLSDKYSPDIGGQLVFYFGKTGVLGQFGPRLWVRNVDNITIGGTDQWQVKAKERVLFVITPQERDLLSEFAVARDSRKAVIKICHKYTGEILGLDGRAVFVFAQNTPDGCSYKFHLGK